MDKDEQFMNEALKEAKKGKREGGIPIGAVLVYDDRIIGRGYNRRVQENSAILHGEMSALEHAGRQTHVVYSQSTMYTTLSPCAMCSGAMMLYDIPRVVIGENKTFQGEEKLLRSRGVELTILQHDECISLMESFISSHPDLWSEDIGE